jgi:hypothetical protein
MYREAERKSMAEFKGRRAAQSIHEYLTTGTW